MVDPDKLEYQDVVINIPKETIYIEVNVKILDDGSLVTLTAKMSPSEIRDALKLFDDTVNGDYPCYQLTEKGEKYFEDLENKYE